MTSHILHAINNVKPIAFLIETLKLSDEEARLLLLAYRVSAIYELCEMVTCRLASDFTDIYAKFLDTPCLKIKALLRSDKKLVSFGLIGDNTEITDDCNECIFSGTLDTFFSNILREGSTEKAFDISSYSIRKEYADLALQFLKSDCASNILLYGNPGSGKAEFAKAQGGKKMEKYVAITGASSGIGYETAKRFAQRGKNIIAVARIKEKLENLKKEILGAGNALAEVIIKAYDLTQKENIYALYNSVKDLDIETWINNAGFSDYCSVGNQNLTKMEEMLSLNIEAVALFSALYVRDFADKEHTQLINVSSVGGYTIVPTAVTY